LGEITPPGDKSISHRALMLASLATGRSEIRGLSSGLDVLATMQIMHQLGAVIESDGELVQVVGSGKLSASSSPLDCGNSGTTMRLMAGICSGIAGQHVLIGDASLSKRPMDRVAVPLGKMGARLSGTGERLTPPLSVHGGVLQGLTYEVPEPSAQVKSAILLAGLFANGITEVTERLRTRAHTEEMLVEAGVSVTSTDVSNGRVVRLLPSMPLPRKWMVATDPSQAAFTIVAGVLAQLGEVVVRDLYAGPERIGFLGVLKRMGADLTVEEHEGRLNVIARPSELQGTTIHSSEIPSVDEVPILAIAALRALSPTRFVDVGELRLKESDRLNATANLVRALGGEATIEGDDLLIEPRGAKVVEAHIDPLHDHRLAMSAAIGALSAVEGSSVTILETECIATSYPMFFADLAALGVNLD
jgi:3-phosphoshikimate 1-carboxyvinyltransferase